MFEWKVGDFIYIPPYCAHKRFNTSGIEVRIVVMNSRMPRLMGSIGSISWSLRRGLKIVGSLRGLKYMELLMICVTNTLCVCYSVRREELTDRFAASFWIIGLFELDLQFHRKTYRVC